MIGPRWFADGRSVLVIARENEHKEALSYRINVETGRAERIMEGINGSLPDPAPVGNVVYFRSPTGVGKYDLDTKRVIEVIQLPDNWMVTEFAVSRDGTQIAFTASGVENGQEARYLAVGPTSGGSVREIHRSTDSGPSRFNALAWTPDQKHLLFLENDSLLWISASGGATEAVGIKINRLKGVSVHPDGKHLYFTAPVPGEVWALENFLPAVAK